MRQIRESRGMTQSELAKETGIPQSVISDIESGKTKNPRIDTMEAIARVLGVKLEELRSESLPDHPAGG